MDSLWDKWSGKFGKAQSYLSELSEDPELKWMQDLYEQKGMNIGKNIFLGQFSNKLPTGITKGGWDTDADIYSPSGISYEDVPTLGVRAEFDPSRVTGFVRSLFGK